jgi:hypothetical protein
VQPSCAGAAAAAQRRTLRCNALSWRALLRSAEAQHRLRHPRRRPLPVAGAHARCGAAALLAERCACGCDASLRTRACFQRSAARADARITARVRRRTARMRTQLPRKQGASRHAARSAALARARTPICSRACATATADAASPLARSLSLRAR